MLFDRSVTGGIEMFVGTERCGKDGGGDIQSTGMKILFSIDKMGNMDINLGVS